MKETEMMEEQKKWKEKKIAKHKFYVFFFKLCNGIRNDRGSLHRYFLLLFAKKLIFFYFSNYNRVLFLTCIYFFAFYITFILLRYKEIEFKTELELKNK